MSKPEKSRYRTENYLFNDHEAKFIADKTLGLMASQEAKAALAAELHRAWLSGAMGAYLWVQAQGTINVGRDWHDGDFMCHVTPEEIEEKLKNLELEEIALNGLDPK